MKRSTGFSLIEVLIATIILGVLIGSLVGPLGGLFRMTKRNQEMLDSTTLAQQVVEKVMRDWRDPDNFARSCLNAATDIPDGVAVEVQDLNASGDPVSGYYPLRDCTSAADSVPLKRLKVTANANGGAPAEIVMDVARPQP